jgi:hypothetical protein
MSDLDYITVNVTEEFPALWKEFVGTNKYYGLMGSRMFNDFLKSKNINAFAKPHNYIGEAQIRQDHLMWMRIKYS